MTKGDNLVMLYLSVISGCLLLILSMKISIMQEEINKLRDGIDNTIRNDK
jgi:hypothetical protein